MKNKTWIQTIRSKVVGFYYTLDTTFAILRVAIFGLLGYAMHQLIFSGNEAVTEKRQPEVLGFKAILTQAFLKLMPYILLGIGLVYLVVLAIMESWKRSELVTFIVITSTLLVFIYKKCKGKNGNSDHVISDDLVQLMAWSALGASLSYGIICLIIEAMEGGMSFGLERTFGVVFFIAFSAILVIMVIPETVRLLKKMGYVKAQLTKGKRAFL